MHFVIVPGIDGSDDQHWQSIWEEAWSPRSTRIEVGSWSEPELDDWCAAIDRAVRDAGRDVVLVAHSLGCLAAARSTVRGGPELRGVFLVAPPDREGESFPTAAPSFRPVEEEPLGRPGLIVCSDNDPYCGAHAVRRLSGDWGVHRVSVGPGGHLNSASGIGRWDAGRGLLTAFVAGLS